jgi:riboflavin biosynthesis pyrimidine reductase
MTIHVVARQPAGKTTEPLDVLYEAAGLPGVHLPPALSEVYGGDLGFALPAVYGNFVASIDGVAALGPEHPSSGSAISGREPADRFLMGLLRACADAVLVGAGTLRATPRHRWTPDHVYPAAAADFADLRRRLNLPARPELVVVTASGDVPADHPALVAGALVATTAHGARRLRGRLPQTCTVVTVGDGASLAMGDVLDVISVRGHRSVLTEGGPRVLGQLIADGLLHELFLTTSPLIAGRHTTPRPGLVDGIELLPHRAHWSDLISLRRRGSYLFLRYRLHEAASAELASAVTHDSKE